MPGGIGFKNCYRINKLLMNIDLSFLGQVYRKSMVSFLSEASKGDSETIPFHFLQLHLFQVYG